MSFKELLKKGKIEEACQIRPYEEIDKETLALAYKNSLVKGNAEKTLDNILNLYGLSKEMPNEEIIQSAYKILLKENVNYFSYFRQLKRIVGVEPNDETIMKCYEYFIIKRKFLSVESLYDLVEKMPDENVIQSSYDRFLKFGDVSSAKKLYDFSKVKPKNKEKIQLAYRQVLINLDFKSASTLNIMTSKKPKNSIIQSCYNKFLKDSDIKKVIFLYDYTHKKPKWKEGISSTYEHILNNILNDFNNLESVYNKLEDIKTLSHITGTCPPKRFIEDIDRKVAKKLKLFYGHWIRNIVNHFLKNC